MIAQPHVQCHVADCLQPTLDILEASITAPKLLTTSGRQEERTSTESRHAVTNFHMHIIYSLNLNYAGLFRRVCS